MENAIYLLSAIIFAPALGALVIAFMIDKRAEDMLRAVAMGTTVVTFLLTLYLWQVFEYGVAGMQLSCSATWIATWNIE